MYKIIIAIFIATFFNFSYATSVNDVNNSSGNLTFFNSLFMLLACFSIFYFLVMRPQIKKDKAQNILLSSMKIGDEVVTTGGIIGKINNIGKNYISLEISKNIIVKFQKNHFITILPKNSVQIN